MSIASGQTATVRIYGFGPPADVVAVDVDLDGEPLRVELDQPDGMTAAGWAALDDYPAMFPGALDPAQRGYWARRMADPADPLTMGAVRAIAYRLAQPLYGMDWWAAHRLCSRAAANWWQYEAWAVTRGFDPRTAPAARIAASCWAWAVSGCTEDGEAEALHREIFEDVPDEELGHAARLARGQATLARLQAWQSG